MASSSSAGGSQQQSGGVEPRPSDLQIMTPALAAAARNQQVMP